MLGLCLPATALKFDRPFYMTLLSSHSEMLRFQESFLLQNSLEQSVLDTVIQILRIADGATRRSREGRAMMKVDTWNDDRWITEKPDQRTLEGIWVRKRRTL